MLGIVSSLFKPIEFIFPGFGFISPVTRGGQICFIPYALLGIPLNILLFNTLLERAVLLITSFLRWGRKRFGERECKPDHKSDPGNESSSLHIGCVSFAVLLAAVLLISILFMYLEDWNYFEAVYFCVVAFTTVGFGDFVPSSSHSEHGKNHSTEYKVGNWILIIVGLVFMYPALAIAASLYKELIAHITDRCYFRVCGAQQVAPTPSVDVIRSNSLTAQSLDGIEGEVDNSLKGSTISLRSPRCQSRCSVIQLGTVSTVETSIMKSRASLRDTPTHIDEKSELDNLLATEARLTKEYVEALAILQKRKLVLTPDKDRLTDPLTHIDSPTESGVFLKVSSSYSNWCNSQQSSVSPYQPQYNS